MITHTPKHIHTHEYTYAHTYVDPITRVQWDRVYSVRVHTDRLIRCMYVWMLPGTIECMPFLEFSEKTKTIRRIVACFYYFLSSNMGSFPL